MRRILLAAAALPLVAGCYQTRLGPIDVLRGHLDAIHEGRYQEAYRAVAAEDQKAKSLEEFTNESEQAKRDFPKLREHKPVIKKIRLEGDRAVAQVVAPSFDTSALIQEVIARRDGDPESVLKEGVQAGRIPIVDRTIEVEMVQKPDGWRIRKGWADWQEALQVMEQRDRLRKEGKAKDAEALDAKTKMIMNRLPGGMSPEERSKMQAEMDKAMGLGTLNQKIESLVDEIEKSGASLKEEVKSLHEPPEPPGPEVIELLKQVKKTGEQTFQAPATLFSDQNLACLQTEITPAFLNDKLIGLRLVKVAPGLLLEIVGFETGDVWTAINGRPLTTPQAFADSLEGLAQASEITFELLRRDEKILITIRVEGD